MMVSWSFERFGGGSICSWSGSGIRLPVESSSRKLTPFLFLVGMVMVWDILMVHAGA